MPPKEYIKDSIKIQIRAIDKRIQRAKSKIDTLQSEKAELYHLLEKIANEN